MTIFIPDRIAVGFQERSDTYTKMLAYVVYYDAKGHRRKEKSWESWCNPKIEKKDFDNVPTSGFVLNKKVGGYKSDWNFRQAYVRVFDPRGFEFEITVPNLLFVLENNSSIKGKGLEGEFVYAWDGTELLLLPVDSPDYQKINSHSALIKTPVKIPSKSLVFGGTYLTKSNEEWVYLGRFERYSTDWDYKTNSNRSRPMGPHFFFAHREGGFTAIKSISGKIIKVVSEDPAPNYAELMDELQHRRMYSPLTDPEKFEFVPVTIPEFQNGGYYPSYVPEKKGCMGLFIRYAGRMTENIQIGRLYPGPVVPNTKGYFIADRYHWTADPVLKILEKDRPELFNRQVGVDITTINELEFVEKYQYLANGQIYHG